MPTALQKWGNRFMADLLLRLVLGKGGETMMAMFYAQRIILGKMTYAQVPAKLKSQVAEILRDSGLEELIEA